MTRIYIAEADLGAMFDCSHRSCIFIYESKDRIFLMNKQTLELYYFHVKKKLVLFLFFQPAY